MMLHSHRGQRHLGKIKSLFLGSVKKRKKKGKKKGKICVCLGVWSQNGNRVRKEPLAQWRLVKKRFHFN